MRCLSAWPRPRSAGSVAQATERVQRPFQSLLHNTLTMVRHNSLIGAQLAARGYYQAFEAVKSTVASVLANENPGRVVDEDHGGWYRELFAPSVAAGIVKPSDLAGYRSERVFIRNSMHVPLTPNAVRDAMPVFFEMLEAEEHPAVRVVLGHFVFVYIHPYMDGNGRMGRFLMNVMMAAGSYPWTVIPVQRRADYMAALERASVHHDIVPFSRFLGELTRQGMSGETTAMLPAS